MNYLFALLAGGVSVLSPCVLPLVPIVLGAAATAHRFGPAALTLGLVTSYAAAGVLVATVGLNFDAEVIRNVAAAGLAGLGIVLLVPTVRSRLALAASAGLGRVAGRFAAWSPRSLAGQFGVGVLLGAVWSPCVGPTLGAATMLAMQGGSPAGLAATMAAFALGAAAPLLLLGFSGRQLMVRWRTGLAAAANVGNWMLGVSLLIAGAAVLSGLDRRLETLLVEASPDWLTRLTTSF